MKNKGQAKPGSCESIPKSAAVTSETYVMTTARGMGGQAQCEDHRDAVQLRWSESNHAFDPLPYFHMGEKKKKSCMQRRRSVHPLSEWAQADTAVNSPSSSLPLLHPPKLCIFSLVLLHQLIPFFSAAE